MQTKKKPWETLPSLALLNIFINLNFKDRFGSIPLVCKEWNSIISNDPRCWSSMIPDSISPDDAFIKKPDYSFQVDPPSKLYDRKGQEIVRDQGVSYLRNFINKSSSCSSGSGSNSTITSLCLDPFHFSNSSSTSTNYDDDSIHQDEILRLIALCCPNLKHISFDGFYCASRKAVVQVFKRCKKIELVDFSDSGYTDSIEVIEILGKCLPNLRGIRIAGWIENESIYDAIATHLPWIKLLALDYKSSYDYDFRKLTSKTKCCLTELQYLSVGLWEIKKPPVCTHIPEFHYEKLHGYECDFGDYEFQPLRSVHQSNKDRPRLDTSKRQVCHTCVSMKEKYEAEAEAKEAQKKECEMSSSNSPQDEIQMRPPARLPTQVFRQSSQVSRPYQPQGISTRPPTQMFRPSSQMFRRPSKVSGPYQPQVFRQSSQVSRPYQPQGISTKPPTQMFRPSSQVFRRPSKVSRPYQPQVFEHKRHSKVYKPYQPQGIPTRPPTQVFRPSSQVSRPYQPQRSPSWQAKCIPIKAPSPRSMRPPPSPRGLRATSPQHVRATPPQYTRAPQHMMSPPHAMRPPPFRSMRPPPKRSKTMANNFTMNKYSYARGPEPQHGYSMNEVRSSYDGSHHGSSYNCNTQPQR